MERKEFMRRLEALLSDLPENERAEALQYYNDYLDDAGLENEAAVLEEMCIRDSPLSCGSLSAKNRVHPIPCARFFFRYASSFTSTFSISAI